MIRYFNGYVLFPMLEKVAKRDIFNKYRDLKRFEGFSSERKLQVRKDELYRIVSFCKERVPYYQDLFVEHAFDIEKIKKDISTKRKSDGSHPAD